MKDFPNDYFSELTLTQTKNSKYFWYSFSIYTICFLITVTTNFPMLAVFTAIQLLSLVVLLISFMKLSSFKTENKYLKFILTLYILWVLVIIIRGFNTEFSFLKQLLFDSYRGIFPYFVPLVILLPRKFKFYSIVFNICVLFAFLYIVFIILNFKYIFGFGAGTAYSREIIEFLSKSLSLPTGFLLLTYKYQHNRYKLLSVIAIFITTIVAVYAARRGLLLITLSIVLFSIIGFLSQKSKLILISFLVYLLILLSGLFIDYDKLFIRMNERAMHDTRSEVENSFYRDFKTVDWVVGRGINGSYYYPTYDSNTDMIGLYRFGIETDYLNLILKGGIIHLMLLLLMAVPSAFLGIFSSNNFFSKAAGFWIIVWLISLYPTTSTTFTLGYMIVFLCVGLGYSKKIRKLSYKDFIEAIKLTR